MKTQIRTAKGSVNKRMAKEWQTDKKCIRDNNLATFAILYMSVFGFHLWQPMPQTCVAINKTARPAKTTGPQPQWFYKGRRTEHCGYEAFSLTREGGGEVLIEEMEGWSPPILSPLIVLKGQLSYFFDFFLRWTYCKTHHVFRLLNSSQKSQEIWKIGHRQSSSFLNWFPDWVTRFP